VAVERDRDLEPALAETTAACKRFALVCADAVDVDPIAVAEPFGRPRALVANLPYGVAATVVLRFFEILPSLEQATVMVQSEVADRMAAAPSTKAYGAYTVKLRLHARPAGRFQVGAGCFLPPPRVESAVIRLERSEPLAPPDVLRQASRVADAAFAQRRKTLMNALTAADLGLDREAAAIALATAGIEGARRGETLSLAEFARLADALPRDRPAEA